MSVSSEVIEILDYLGDKLGIAIDWTNENIIPYLQVLINKFIKWEISTSNCMDNNSCICYYTLSYLNEFKRHTQS